MFHSTLIYNEIQGAPSAHSSSLIALPNRLLKVAFFAGQYEKSPDVAIWESTLELSSLQNDLKWSPPIELVRIPNHSMGSPVWYLTPSGRLYLFYLVMHHGRIVPSGWSVCTIQYSISEDLGKSWSSPQFLRKMWFWVTRCLPIVTNIGTVILPIHRELFQYQSMAYINENMELTGKWRRFGRLKTPRGCLEPSITKLASGELVCALRTLDKFVYFSRSNDHGKTWSNPEKSEFQNPNSQVCIITLQSGKVIMAFNNAQTGRSPLSLTISSDKGHIWCSPINIENNPGMEYSYPCLLQTPDQKIHLSYTYHRKSIKYCMFDEAWLIQQFPTTKN
jgi:predicted neuraminidase